MEECAQKSRREDQVARSSTHTITKLAESGAGDETIMAIAGHVSRSMLRRYAHIRTEAKRRALEAITTQARPDSDTPLTEASPLELTVN